MTSFTFSTHSTTPLTLRATNPDHDVIPNISINKHFEQNEELESHDNDLTQYIGDLQSQIESLENEVHSVFYSLIDTNFEIGFVSEQRIPFIDSIIFRIVNNPKFRKRM